MAERITRDPPGSVSVSIIKDVELLDATGIGSTVNVEDIVRVSSPVIELLAESVTRDPPGSVSVSKIKDADVVGVRELEAVERATVFDIDSPSDPSGLVEVDDCGETDELRLPLIILGEIKIYSELDLAVWLAELLYDDAEDEVVVTVVQQFSALPCPSLYETELAILSPNAHDVEINLEVITSISSNSSD